MRVTSEIGYLLTGGLSAIEAVKAERKAYIAKSFALVLNKRPCVRAVRS